MIHWYSLFKRSLLLVSVLSVFIMPWHAYAQDVSLAQTKTRSFSSFYYIQNAHANIPVQKKIYATLRSIADNEGLDILFMEGMVGEPDLSLVRAFPLQSEKERIISKYLEDGRINGAEAFALSAPDDIAVFGVEDERLYLRNLEIYARMLKERDAYLESYQKLQRKCMPEIERILPAALLSFPKKYSRLNAGGDYTGVIDLLLNRAKEQSVSPGKFFSAYRYIKDADESVVKRLDEKVQQVRTRIISEDEAASEKLASIELDYKAGRMRKYEYMLSVCGLASEAIPKELIKYAEAQTFLDGAGPRVIQSEINSLYLKIARSYLNSEKQQLFFDLYSGLSVMERLLLLKAYPEDISFLKEHSFLRSQKEFHAFFKDINVNDAVVFAGVDLASAFYETALARESVFLKDIMNRSKGHAAAFVGGGFHSDGVERGLRQIGVSCERVIPAIEKKVDHSVYEKIISGYGSLFGIREGIAGGTVELFSQIGALPHFKTNKELVRRLYEEILPEFLEVLNSHPERDLLLKAWKRNTTCLILEECDAGKYEFISVEDLIDIISNGRIEELPELMRSKKIGLSYLIEDKSIEDVVIDRIQLMHEQEVIKNPLAIKYLTEKMSDESLRVREAACRAIIEEVIGDEYEALQLEALDTLMPIILSQLTFPRVCENEIDLHSHTLHSDGYSNPVAWMLQAFESGVRTFSITDHNTVPSEVSRKAVGIINRWVSVHNAKNGTNMHALNFVEGTEVSCKIDGIDCHWPVFLPADFRDRAVNDKDLSDFLDRMESARSMGLERMIRICENISREYPEFAVTIDDIFPFIRGDLLFGNTLTVGLFAKYKEKFLAMGVNSAKEVWHSFIVDKDLDYTASGQSQMYPSVEKVMDFVSEIGGSFMIAHPNEIFGKDEGAFELLLNRIAEYSEKGLIDIEQFLGVAYYCHKMFEPKNNEKREKTLEVVTRLNNMHPVFKKNPILLLTEGDSHGKYSPKHPMARFREKGYAPADEEAYSEYIQTNLVERLGVTAESDLHDYSLDIETVESELTTFFEDQGVDSESITSFIKWWGESYTRATDSYNEPFGFYDGTESQFTLLKSLFEDHIRRSQQKEVLIYQFGLGKIALESTQIMRAFSEVLQKLVPNEAERRQWTFRMIALDASDENIERAQKRFEDLSQFKYSAGARTDLDIYKTRLMDRARFDQITQKYGKADFVFCRHVLYANHVRFTGFSFPLENNRYHEMPMLYYRSFSNLISGLSKKNGYLFVEPYDGDLSADSLLLPGTDIIPFPNEGADQGSRSGVYKITDPEEIQKRGISGFCSDNFWQDSRKRDASEVNDYIKYALTPRVNELLSYYCKVFGEDKGLVMVNEIIDERFDDFWKEYTLDFRDVYSSENKSEAYLQQKMQIKRILRLVSFSHGYDYAIKYCSRVKCAHWNEGRDLLGKDLMRMNALKGVLLEVLNLKESFGEDFHHGLWHSLDLMLKGREIAERLSDDVSGQIDWLVFDAAALVHDIFAHESESHGKKAAEFLSILFKSLPELDKLKIEKIKSAVALHDNRKTDGYSARKQAGVEAMLLYDSDQAAAFDVEGVYRFAAIFAQRGKGLNFLKEKIAAKISERKATLHFDATYKVSSRGYAFAHAFYGVGLNSLMKNNSPQKIAQFFLECHDVPPYELIKRASLELSDTEWFFDRLLSSYQNKLDLLFDPEFAFIDNYRHKWLQSFSGDSAFGHDEWSSEEIDFFGRLVKGLFQKKDRSVPNKVLSAGAKSGMDVLRMLDSVAADEVFIDSAFAGKAKQVLCVNGDFIERLMLSKPELQSVRHACSFYEEIWIYSDVDFSTESISSLLDVDSGKIKIIDKQGDLSIYISEDMSLVEKFVFMGSDMIEEISARYESSLNKKFFFVSGDKVSDYFRMAEVLAVTENVFLADGFVSAEFIRNMCAEGARSGAVLTPGDMCRIAQETGIFYGVFEEEKRQLREAKFMTAA